MADKERKVGFETIVLALIMIVVIGGFYMTWKVVDEAAQDVQEDIEVRTNALGFRGPAWDEAETAGRAVLLLGDSQMFGYGVDEADALAARLSERLQRPVLNAAVPTWGPTEYARAAEDLVPRYRPAHVVFVANLANDWVEAHVPNTRRMTARDGWARRAPGPPRRRGRRRSPSPRGRSTRGAASRP